jgi:dihydroorotate dehydrogenase
MPPLHGAALTASLPPSNPPSMPVDLYPLIRPLLFAVDPERAHELAVRAVALGLGRLTASGGDDPALRTRLFGREIPNPIGLAAGFDKRAEAADRLFDLGFGFVEVGGVTPLPQIGNPRPRLFRLTEDRGVINRFGLNGDGVEAMAARLADRDPARGMLGVNIGANKDSADRTGDYVAVLERLGPLVDFTTLNVSSPNTPGLRALQGRDELARLLDRVLEARARRQVKAALVLKIAPDVSEADLDDIAVLSLDRQLDGLIVGNTTIGRPDTLRSAHRGETGGLSGAPLFQLSTRMLHAMHVRVGARVPLIGTGGIFTVGDVLAKFAAGATAVQLYSGLVFEGPGLVGRLKRGLAAARRK